jgi:serine/threonine protein phosphatase PrpC
MSRSISNVSKPNSVFIDPASSRACDPGYGRTKKRKQPGFDYTEDRSSWITYTYGQKNYKVMWVTDGHGGDEVTKFIATQFGVRFKEFADKNVISVSNGTDEPDMSSTLTQLFEHLQTVLKTEFATKRRFSNSGCTFCACVLDTKTNELTVANLGDSVCQVFRDGVRIFRTEDHDAGSTAEQARINQVFDEYYQFKPLAVQFRRPRNLFYLDSGTVRFYGGLMVTGGFGDFHHEMVPGCIRRIPDITKINLKPNDVIVLSSDGLFETIKPNCSIGPGRDENEICADVTKYFESEESTGSSDVTLSKFLIDRHVTSMMQKVKEAHPTYASMQDEQIRSIVMNGKDNCDVITHRISVPLGGMARSISA